MGAISEKVRGFQISVHDSSHISIHVVLVISVRKKAFSLKTVSINAVFLHHYLFVIVMALLIYRKELLFLLFYIDFIY